MSAYIVDRTHIVYLVKAAMALDVYNSIVKLNPHSSVADQMLVGQALWDENILSVGHRYEDTPQDDLPGPIEESFRLVESDFDVEFPGLWIDGPHNKRIQPDAVVQVVKAAHCYSYQSCEHDGWESSAARGIANSIISNAVSYLSGYDGAIWGSPAPTSGTIVELGRLFK